VRDKLIIFKRTHALHALYALRGTMRGDRWRGVHGLRSWQGDRCVREGWVNLTRSYDEE